MSGSTQIIEILIDLMRVPSVEIHTQVEFWPDFFLKIAHSENKQLFEPHIFKLLGNISQRALLDEATFTSMNTVPIRDASFDEMYHLR